MRHLAVLRVCAIALAAVLASSAHAGASERTGEVLRDLLRGVEESFETLEQQTSGFAARAAALTRTLEEAHRAFASETDPIKQHVLRSKAYEAAARLNQQDRTEVETTLRVIGDVRDKVGRIRGVLEDSGIVPRREEMARFQKNLGRWGRSAARLLDAWSDRVGPESRAEIEALKRSLSGAFGAWETPAGRAGSDADLQRTVRTLDAMYSNLIGLQRSLEQEKTLLQVRNQQALLDLLLFRVTQGNTSVRSLTDAVGAKQRDVQQRQRLVGDLDGVASAGAGSGTPALRGDDAARFERIKRGDFSFGGK